MWFTETLSNGFAAAGAGADRDPFAYKQSAVPGEKSNVHTDPAGSVRSHHPFVSPFVRVIRGLVIPRDLSVDTLGSSSVSLHFR